MAKLKFANPTKLFIEAAIILIVGGGLSFIFGSTIAAFAASGPFIEGVIGIGLAVVTLMFLKASDLGVGKFTNIIVLFGIAAGMSQIVASFVPASSAFLLGLGGALTPVGLVSLLFFASMADYIGDQVGL